MSDDRLFASNNAIGRKWYFLNLIILAAITAGTYYLFTGLIVPNVTSDVYGIISKGILYFALFVYAITFFSLIDRRLFDSVGTRDSKIYKNVSSIMVFTIFLVLFDIFCKWKNPQLPFSSDIITIITSILCSIYVLIAFILMFTKGRISNLSYDEYRRKIKYE